MSDYLKDLDKEVERRIDIINSPDYEFVPTIGKGDIIAMVLIVITSIFIMAICYNVWA